MRDPLRMLLGRKGQERDRVDSIPVDQIRLNPYQPRKIFDEERLDELARSISSVGVIQPITVRKIGEEYEVVAGERRLRAARIAGLTHIPAIIKEATDREAARISLIENLQREDLNPLEEALGYQQLINEFNLTQQELAELVSKSQSTIANKLRLLKLPEEVQRELRGNSITERHARALLRLHDQGEQLEVLKQIKHGTLNVRETDAIVNDILREKTEARTGGGKGKRRGRMVGVVQDVRLFFNEVERAAKLLRQSGFEVSIDYEKREDDWEIKVAISRS